MFRTLVTFSMAALAYSSCDNGCSGHGVCSCGQCLCYDNWGMGYDLDTGDCSDRICPFEFAWVDTPNKIGAFHKYAECSNKGICNRESGECECFEGYEGKGCQRTSCPNDCSGHGTCEYIDRLGFANTPFLDVGNVFTQDVQEFPVATWDTLKTRGCVCDPEYGDVDCSKRMCNYGNDMMDKFTNSYITAGLNQKQQIRFVHEDDITLLNGKTFALTFKSKLNETFTTAPIAFTNTLSTLATRVSNALVRLPNGIIDAVNVVATYGSPSTTKVNVEVEFTGIYVQGAQNLLVVEDYKCTDGCTPFLDGLQGLSIGTQVITESVATDFNSFECGRRGKCDYDTGVCQCFAGFTGPSCNSCTAMI